MRIATALLVLGIFWANVFWANDINAFNRWPRADNDVNATLGEYRSTHFHGGIDMPNQDGQPVYAVEAGTVKVTGWQGGYGYTVVIAHNNGQATLYGHLSTYTVTKVGATGTTSPHLHFEVKNTPATNWNTYLSADYLNPLQYLPALTGADADDTDPTLQRTVVIQLNDTGELLGAPQELSLPVINPADPYGNAPKVYVSGRVRQLIRGYDKINVENSRVGFYRLDHSIYSYQTKTELTSYQITFDTVAYTERQQEEWVYSDGSDTGTSSFVSRIGGTGTQYYYKLYNNQTGNISLIRNITISDTSDILENDGTWKTKKAKAGVPQDAYGNATKNADARTPDGKYRCNYHAYDFAGNQKNGYLHVYVNNFNQRATSCNSSGDSWSTFFVGQIIYANGSEYVPGKSYNLYVFPHQRLLDGDTIPAMSGFPIQVTGGCQW